MTYYCLHCGDWRDSLVTIDWVKPAAEYVVKCPVCAGVTRIDCQFVPLDDEDEDDSTDKPA